MFFAPGGQAIGVRTQGVGVEGQQRRLEVGQRVLGGDELSVGGAVGGGRNGFVPPIEPTVCETGHGGCRNGFGSVHALIPFAVLRF